ncbi:hypothetical protein [Xenorhabdus bovienii]|uniref:hypothetical protein n=1 Tax=Xenorhabdus bovienii TaxID=40576 RepID=UPI0023B3007F|nr:hypothetical protein [Xenorhabdus bovienii]MDE9455669.1 hypothetical protein [Xenorhabdus bovienii]
MWYVYLSAVIFNLVLSVFVLRLLYELSITFIRTASATRWPARCAGCRNPIKIIKHFIGIFPVTESTTRIRSKFGEWCGVGDWIVYAENDEEEL